MKKPFKNIILKIALSFLLLAIASLLIQKPFTEDKSPAIVYLMIEISNKLNGEQITLSSA
jgi:hypothetical protein